MSRETHYKWEWDLASSREDLWPEVSNTERFNKAIGLPEPTFSDAPHEKGGHTRTAIARKGYELGNANPEDRAALRKIMSTPLIRATASVR